MYVNNFNYTHLGTVTLRLRVPPKHDCNSIRGDPSYRMSDNLIPNFFELINCDAIQRPEEVNLQISWNINPEKKFEKTPKLNGKLPLKEAIS